MATTIRLARFDDLEHIVALFSEFFPFSEPENIIEEYGTVSFVACEDGKVVGYANIRTLKADKKVFSSLLVTQPYQRRGIGTALSNTRIRYLKKNNFQGIAYSDAVTSHPFSQQQLFSVGFSSFRVFPQPETVNQETETTIGFAKIFSPVGLWQPESTSLSLYLASQHHDIAREILSPFGTVTFHETNTHKPTDRARAFAASEFCRSATYKIPLYQPSAPADIRFFLDNGYALIGFSPVIHDTKLSAAAEINYIKKGVNKEKIKIIPEARSIFDFVMEQYAR